MEDLVQQLKEQVATLSLYIKEEQNNHAQSQAKMQLEHEIEMEKVIKEQDAYVEKLVRKHEATIHLLKSHHKSILKVLENTLQDRIKRMRNEYALLQAALRNYKEIVRSDMGKIWSEKEESLRLENDEKISQIVRMAKINMEQQFAEEKLEMQKSFKSKINQRMSDSVNKIMLTLVNDPKSESELNGQESFQSTDIHTEVKRHISDQASSSNILFVGNDNSSMLGTVVSNAESQNSMSAQPRQLEIIKKDSQKEIEYNGASDLIPDGQMTLTQKTPDASQV